MSFDMAQFTQVFFDETQEHLATIEKVLLALDVAAPDPEDLNAIFRAAHSIKGGAGTFGFNDMADFTHVMETLLDRLRKGELGITTGMVDALLDAKDVIGRLLAAHQSGAPADDSVEADVRERLTMFACLDDGAEAAAAPAAKPAPVVAAARSRFVIRLEGAAGEAGMDNVLEELGSLGSLLVVQRPESGRSGAWELRLDTSADADELRDMIGYVLPAERIAVEHAGAAPADAASGDGFGFFDEAAGAPEAASGFGFFDEAPGAPVADPGYGLYEPVAVAVEAAPAGFGFFDDAPGKPVAEAADEPIEDTVRARSPGRRDTDGPVESGSRAGRRQNDKTVVPATAAAADSSIRVSVEKVDQLINLVGELVITQSMLAQAVGRTEGALSETLTNGVAQLERNSRDLQEAVMSIRMMPIAFVFSRFPRLVRDLAAKLDKQVDLKLVGEQTELDKGVIEKIADPLTHLLRNSLDHGLETREEREASGKPEVGTIALRAFHQGGNIVIQVVDDGRGLNRDKILAKAKSRGMAVSDDMSDGDVFSLIFEPGFSTAEVVTDVSGRGVGMDVVRRNIHALGGRVEISSQLGKGCTVSIRLPLTLAILDGMSVAVGQELYILPLGFIVESLQPGAADIKTISGQGVVLKVRGDYLPVIRLHEAMGVQPRVEAFHHGIMVILEAEGARVAMFVDELVGQHQVVIKSIESNYRKVPGISAATIMGDGRVAMILDAGHLVRVANARREYIEAA
jgi:two-component system, chemotaxis family, sensor kinase CheA